MGRHEHEIRIRLLLEPDEHTEQAPSWDALVERVRAVLVEARDDPAFAPIADLLDPDNCLEFGGQYLGTLYRDLFEEWGVPYFDEAIRESDRRRASP